MGIIRKLITGSKTIDPDFISAAEDLAIDLPQAKLTGQQAKAYFKKNGAKDRELEALGLDGLFEQDKTTKQEILNKIDENRIEFESEIDGGPGVGFDKAITFDTQDLTAREFFGDDGFLNEVDFLTSDTSFNRFLAGDFIVDQIFPYGFKESDFKLLNEIQDSFGKINFNHPVFNNVELPPGLEDFAEGTLAYVDLPDETAFKIYQKAEDRVMDEYYFNPAQKLTMYVDGEPTQYELFKREQDTEWRPSEINSPPFIQQAFDGMRPPDSINEARVQLQALGEEIGDLDIPENQVRYKSYSTVDGKNYAEERVRIKKMPAFDPDPTFGVVDKMDFGDYSVFQESHFPEDINNIFHIRTSDHIHKDKSGKEKNYKVVEEFQSDWAQQGRERLKPMDPFDPDGPKKMTGGFTTPTFRSTVLEKTKQLKKKMEEIYGPDFGFADDPYRNDPFKIRNIKDDLSAESAPRIYGQVFRDIQANQKFITKTTEKFENRFINTVIRRIIGREKLVPLAEKLDDKAPMTSKEVEALEKIVNDIAEEIPEDVKNHFRETTRPGKYGDDINFKPGLVPDEIRRKDDAFDIILKKAYEPRQDLDGKTFFEVTVPPKIKKSTGLDIEQIVEANDYIAKDSDLAAQVARKKTEYNPVVADTPTWTNMGLKHIFKNALDEGFDGVAFVPGELQVNRWGDEGLETYYDKIIPKQIEKVFGKKKPETERETILLRDYADSETNDPNEGYISSVATVYEFDEELKNGKTFAQKLSDGVTSFSAPVAGLGLAGLAALSPEESQAAEDMAAEVESMKASRVNPDVAAFADAVSGGAQVLGEGIMDLLIEPAVEYGAGRVALGLGKSPEEITQTAKKAREKINYEVSSPTAKRYKDRILEGLGGLGQYLTGEGTERTMPLGVMRPGMGRPTTIETKKRDPLQAAFQDIYEPSAEALTEGIMALQYPFDESKEAQAAREASRDFVEVIQPL